MLTALPVFLLALIAIPGSLLIARLGARTALVAGLVVVALAGAARTVGGGTAILFAGTLFMGAGIAICQPALPSLVRSWASGSVGLATAAFTNGMLVGEILPAAITASLFLPLAGGWQPALAV